MADNLWGEIPLGTDIRTPHAVLLEQAQILTEQTKGLLVGRVSRTSQAGSFSSALQIVAPSLGNYIYTVLSLQYDVKLYPLTIWSGSAGSSAQDEAQLVKALGEILSSKQVRDVIRGLLAQIRADTETKE